MVEESEHTIKSFPKPVEKKEPNSNDLAEKYLEESPKTEDLFGLEPGWEEGIFFDSLEEAWPGLELIDEGEMSLMSKQEWLFEQTKFFNDLFERQNSGWRAFPSMDDKDGSFVMLHCDIGETGEYVVQKVKMPRIKYAEAFGKHLYWDVDSLAIGSYESGSVIVLDKVIKANTPGLIVHMGTQYTEGDEKPNELPNFYRPLGNLLFAQNPDLERDGLFSFLHELSHAKEHHYFKGEFSKILDEARYFSFLDTKSRRGYLKAVKKNNRLLSPALAQRMVVRQERRAWVATASLLKIISEKAKERGAKFKFGDYNTRKRVLDYSEANLESYDSLPIDTPRGISGEIPDFSQQNRARARQLEKVGKQGRN